MDPTKNRIGHQPTWVALSTPQGKAALAVIRLSGDQSFAIVQRIFKGKTLSKQKTHTIHYGHIHTKGILVDEVVVALFRAPKSYTGEDMVEISCHGSPYIVQQIIDHLCLAGAELAPPGGFSQRAFLNGKMDLVQAEATTDLIQAETHAQHQVAIQQLKGRLSKRLNALRQLLLDAAAHLTLSLDFAEEDVAFAPPEAIHTTLAQALKEIKTLTKHFEGAKRLKEGLRVAIIGRPNVGKSTLLNALSQEKRAIVSANPGTTRDSVEAHVQLNGLSVLLVDTAGLRQAQGKIEQLGVARSIQQAQEAALVVYVFDARKDPNTEHMAQFNLSCDPTTTLMVANKTDLISDKRKQLLSQKGAYLCISAQKGMGLQALKGQISQMACHNMPKPESVWITHARHKQKLEQATPFLKSAQKGLRQQLAPELIAHDIEQACRSVGEITGQVTHEDVLAHIFQHFCIGK